MIREIKKIWFDTLTGPDGKYSRKSLTAFVAFVACLVTFVLDGLKWFEINTELWYGMLTLTGSTIAMTVWDKGKKKDA